VGDVLLSASLIVKNEERFLEGCLASIRDLADEIVVADTGSTDRSMDIARSFGATVFEYPWTGDFAAARNAALDRCRGRWILYIDADERVRPCPPAELRAWLTRARTVAYRVLFHVRPGYSPYREMRLFRNHPLIRFEGEIHENIWHGIRRHQAAEGSEVADCDLSFDHFGYEGDQSPKAPRNLPLLLAALERHPGKSFHWWHLAQTYELLGEHDRARAALEEGVDRVRAKAQLGAVDGLPFAALIQVRLGRGEDPRPLVDEALRLFPGNLQFHWFHARLLMNEERFAEAIPIFEWLLERGRKRDYDHVAAYDVRLFGVLSYDSLATCCYRLGRDADAARYYALAAGAQPENLEYRVKQRLCEDLAAGRTARHSG
jgi:tetratricopeptide (TPR) repeat protein